MIPGFNTDIEYEGVVYHVQTEDKGEKSRLILTLVYDRGTILASKRVKYEDLTEADLQPAALSERLQRQHQLICGAVKAGRLNDLKSMTARDRKAAGAAAKPSSRAPVSAEAVAPPEPPPVIPATAQLMPAVSPVIPAEAPQVQVAVAEVPAAQLQIQVAEVAVPAAVPLPDPALTPVPAPYTGFPAIASETEAETIPVYEIFDDGPLIDGVSIIEDEDILPAEAVAVVTEFSGHSRPSNKKLSIEMLGEPKFKGGDRKTLSIMICRGTDRKVIGDAEIMVKVLGSSFRPVIFHARSDANGLAKVHLQLPHFETGRAALLIRARNNGDETELRKIVTPG